LIIKENKFLDFSSDILYIVGGSEILQRVPYQVSLQYRKNDGVVHYCGGSIISPYHVLTAAHCVSPVNIRKILVVGGTNNLLSKKNVHTNVVAADIHHNFEVKRSSDIAILHVDPPFPLDNKHISTIRVLDEDYIGADVPVLLTGWGARIPLLLPFIPEYIAFPSQLKGLKYKTITNEECRARGMQNVSETELCAVKAAVEGACIVSLQLKSNRNSMSQTINIVFAG